MGGVKRILLNQFILTRNIGHFFKINKSSKHQDHDSSIKLCGVPCTERICIFLPKNGYRNEQKDNEKDVADNNLQDQITQAPLKSKD